VEVVKVVAALLVLMPPLVPSEELAVAEVVLVVLFLAAIHNLAVLVDQV
jgi:hypothetical protein